MRYLEIRMTRMFLMEIWDQNLRMTELSRLNFQKPSDALYQSVNSLVAPALRNFLVWKAAFSMMDELTDCFSTTVQAQVDGPDGFYSLKISPAEL